MFLISKDHFRIKITPKKGRGIFAKTEIKSGTVIGDYLGKIIKPEEDIDGDENGIYIMEAHKNKLFHPDDNSIGIHIINHSCTPCCAMIPFEGHMIFFALRKIIPSEELTVSYFVKQERNGGHYFCGCQSPLCRGTMYIPKEYSEIIENFFKEKHGNYYNNLETPFGEYLKPLSKYPENIEDFEIYDLFANFEKEPAQMTETKLPDSITLRKLIRENGVPLNFLNLNYLVYGVTHERLIVGKQHVIASRIQ